jgi:hypothetical protein
MMVVAVRLIVLVVPAPPTMMVVVAAVRLIVLVVFVSPMTMGARDVR